MLREVTLGRYYPGTSFLHCLDPRTKLLGALVYIVAVFLSSSPVACALVFLCLCLLIALSRVPLRFIVKGLGSMAAVLVFVCLLNVLLSKGGSWKAVLITLRMVELVFISNLVTLTTKPKALSDGLEKALGWLGIFKVPVHDLATTICIAMRFLPILATEAGQVIDAQRARGAELGKGNLLKRARALIPVLVPMFVSAFRKADELSVAMDSRLYGSGRVSQLRPLSYGREDAAAYICIFTFLAEVLLMKVAGL